jgi:hypothetical protein
MYLKIRVFTVVRSAMSLAAVTVVIAFSAFAQEEPRPGKPISVPSATAKKQCAAPRMPADASLREYRSAPGQLKPVTFVPPDGCHIHEIVDVECYGQCIDERGLPAKNFCRQACKYTVIECDTFPSGTT